MSNKYDVNQMDKIFQLNNTQKIQPETDMAEMHLTLLDPNAIKFYFVALKEGRTPKSWHDSFASVKDELVKLNRLGYGIYITVNETDASGSRKAENIIRIRAVFEEQDNPNKVPAIYPVPSSFEVESSPGKFHRYFSVKDKLDRDEYRNIQISISVIYGSDPTCKDLPRLLRLAGFYHCKREPARSELWVRIYNKASKEKLGLKKYSDINWKIEEIDRDCTYTEKELIKAFPKVEVTNENKHLYENYSSIEIDEESPKIAGAARCLSRDTSVLNDYDSWIKGGIAIKSILPGDNGLELWKFVSLGCEKYNDRDNDELMDSKWTSFSPDGGITLGTFYYYARLAGWIGREVYDQSGWPRLDGNKKPQFLCTDAMNGWRIAISLGKDRLYVRDEGKYLWNNVCWERTDDGAKLVGNTLSNLVLKEAQRYTGKLRKELLQHAQNCESKITKDKALAESDLFLQIHPSELDRDKYLLPTLNKSLKYTGKASEIRENRREDFFTKHAKVNYNPNVKPGLIRQYIDYQFGDDPQSRDYFLSILSTCLLGINPRKFWIVIGDGGEGKSALFNAIGEILGDFYQVLSPDSLTKANYSKHPTYIAKIHKARMIVSYESSQRMKLDESLIKMLTGESKTAARFMRQDEFNVELHGSFFLVTNYLPEVEGSDEAIWSRLEVIRVPKVIPDAIRDPEFLDKILSSEDEKSDILNLLIEGRKLHLDKVPISEAFKVETELYQEQSSSIIRFIKIFDHDNPNRFISGSDMYRLYTMWGEKSEEILTGNKTFHRMARSRLRAHKRNGTTGYLGYALQKAIGQLWLYGGADADFVKRVIGA